jgi:hypothetical protein
MTDHRHQDATPALETLQEARARLNPRGPTPRARNQEKKLSSGSCTRRCRGGRPQAARDR